MQKLSFTLWLAKFFKNLFYKLVMKEITKCNEEKEKSVQKEKDAEEALQNYKKQQEEYRKSQDQKRQLAEEIKST